MAFVDIGPYFRLIRRPIKPRARLVDGFLWAAAVLYVLFVMVPKANNNRFAHDLYQFWVTGQALRTMKITNVYSPQDDARITAEFRKRAENFRSPSLRARTTPPDDLKFTATPLLVSWLTAVSSGDFEVDVVRFRIASAIVYGAGILALAAALGMSGAWAFVLLVVFSAYFYPYRINLAVTNVSAIQAGFFMLVLLLTRGTATFRHGLLGFCLGTLNLLKPTMAPATVLLLVHYLSERRWRDAGWYAAGGAAAGVVGLAVPWFMFGKACNWLSWRAAMPPLCFTPWGLKGGFLYKLGGIDDPSQYGLLSFVLFAAVALYFVKSAQRLRLRNRIPWVRDASAAALGALISIVASPIIRSHYFLAAVPAALITLRPSGLPSAAGAVRSALRILAVFLLAGHAYIRSHGFTRDPNHSLWTFIGAWILLALLAWERSSKGGPVAGALDGHRGTP